MHTLPDSVPSSSWLGSAPGAGTVVMLQTRSGLASPPLARCGRSHDITAETCEGTSRQSHTCARRVRGDWTMHGWQGW